MTTFARSLALVCLAIAVAAPAQGSIMTVALVDGQNRDSGWLAELPDSQAARNITDIVVDPSGGTVTITIVKDYVGHTGSGADMEFPVGKITFRQTLSDPLTLTHIVVRGETIQNHTGVPWTAYVWNVIPSGLAWFNTDLTVWNVAPLTSQVWTDQVGSKANVLVASNGIVPDGGTFSPSGNLVIDVNLALAGAVSFDLKQIVVPEPGTIGLLAVASLGWLRRRRLMPRRANI